MYSTISFGVDADASGWVMVRARRCWGRTATDTISAAQVAGVELTEPAGPLRDAIASVAPLRRMVTAAAPAADTIVRRIVAPMMRPARARKVLPSLLDVQLPFRIEDCAVVLPELRRVGESTEALAVAIPRAALERRRTELEAIGVAPTGMDVEGLAVWDAGRREFGDPPAGEIRIVVHATPARWVCAFGGAGGLEGVLAIREPPADKNTDAVWTRVEAMIRSALAGRSGGEECWIWFGRPADRVAAWADEMAARRGAASAVRIRTSAQPEIALARALAVRAIDGTLWSANLLGADEMPDDVRRARDLAMIWATAGVWAASAALLGVEGWKLSSMAARERELAAMVDRRAREVGGLSRVQRGLEVRMAREAVERRLAALAPLDRLFQPPQTAVLAGLLRLAAEAQIHLELVELSDRAARIEGTAPDRDAAHRVEEFLRMLGFKARTEAGPATPEGRTPFVAEGNRP